MRLLVGKRLGYTNEVWVSRILSPDTGERFGLERTKEILTYTFPFNPILQRRLEYYLRFTHEREIRMRRAIRNQIMQVKQDNPLSILKNLVTTPSALHLQLSTKKILEVVNQGNSLINYVAPRDMPLEFAAICLGAAQEGMNQPDEAFFYAKLAEKSLDYASEAFVNSNQEQYDNLLLGALHTQANALHHLGAYREAMATYRRVEKRESKELKAFDRQILVWKPAFYRDRIATLSHIPKFKIEEAEAMAHDAKRAIDTSGSAISQTLDLLVDRALAGAHMAHAKHKGHKKASKVLNNHLDYLEKNPDLDSVIKTMLYRTYAQISWQESNSYPSDDWIYFVNKALKIGLDADHGLQLAGLRRNFGPVVDELFHDIAGSHSR